jgi:hypothetical protein
VGYVLAILSVLLAFGLVVFAGYGKARSAKRRAERQIR